MVSIVVRLESTWDWSLHVVVPRQYVSHSSSSLTPAIWRLVFFQVYGVDQCHSVDTDVWSIWSISAFRAFFSVETLAALSTVIDTIAHDGKPSPFGTQHIALILAAWGPSVIFGKSISILLPFSSTLIHKIAGCSPAIRRRLMFWQ